MIIVTTVHNWHPQRESAASILPPLKGDLTALLRGEPMGEREAQATSLNAAAQRIMSAIEGLEDFLFFAVRHAHSAIENARVDPAVFDPRHEFDFLPFTAVFLSV